MQVLKFFLLASGITTTLTKAFVTTTTGHTSDEEYQSSSDSVEENQTSVSTATGDLINSIDKTRTKKIRWLVATLMGISVTATWVGIGLKAEEDSSYYGKVDTAIIVGLGLAPVGVVRGFGLDWIITHVTSACRNATTRLRRNTDTSSN